MREIMSNRALAAQDRLIEFYLDESYIHHHYHKILDSVFVPND